MTAQQAWLVAIAGGLGGMFGWGCADFFAKWTIDRIGDIASLTWAHVFGTLLLASAALFRLAIWRTGLDLPSSLPVWGELAFFGALQAIVYLLVYHAFGKGQVAVLNPIFASFSGIVALVSLVALGEPVTMLKVSALVLVFVGIFLLSNGWDSLRFRFVGVPGLGEVAIATALAAGWTLGWDRSVSGSDWLTFALIMYTFMTLAVLVVAAYQRVDLTQMTPRVSIFLVLIGAGETLAYLAISLGYSKTSLTSIVALLSGAFSLPTIVLARIFLRERLSRAQFAGSLVVVAGVMILSLR